MLELVGAMDDMVAQQIANVACLPGIVGAAPHPSYALCGDVAVLRVSENGSVVTGIGLNDVPTGSPAVVPVMPVKRLGV